MYKCPKCNNEFYTIYNTVGNKCSNCNTIMTDANKIEKFTINTKTFKYSAQFFCSECNHIMPDADYNTNNNRKTIFCLNNKCTQKGIQYHCPSINLTRVEE